MVVSTSNQHKTFLMEYFTFPYWDRLHNPMCYFPLQAHLGGALFQMLSSHMWLVALEWMVPDGWHCQLHRQTSCHSSPDTPTSTWVRPAGSLKIAPFRGTVLFLLKCQSSSSAFADHLPWLLHFFIGPL